MKFQGSIWQMMIALLILFWAGVGILVVAVKMSTPRPDVRYASLCSQLGLLIKEQTEVQHGDCMILFKGDAPVSVEKAQVMK